MPAEMITMRYVREVLRLKFIGGVPTREIARRSDLCSHLRPQSVARPSKPLARYGAT